MSTQCSCGPDIAPIQLSENWCRTKVMVSKCVLTWSIENFRSCRQKNNEHIRSPTCLAGPDKDLEWCLDLYPKGSSGFPDCIAVHPKVIAYRGNNPVLLQFRTSLMDDQGRLTNFHSFSLNLTANQTSIPVTTHPRFTTMDYVCLPENHLLLQGMLRIHCCVSVTYDESDVCCQRCSRDTVSPVSQLSEDFSTLLTGKKFADVILVTDLKQIPAHKNILVSRSSVFAAMFDHEMKEQKDNKVDVADVTTEVLEDLLFFMYTGRSKLVSEKNNYKWMSVAELLSAADKYDVQALKKACADSLESNLNVDNACEVLALADAHSEGKLKKFAVDFINANAPLVIGTPGWNNVLKQSPTIIADVFVATVDVDSSVTVTDANSAP